MTAAGQNLLCLQLAASIGVSLDDPFKLWLTGSCVPAVLGESRVEEVPPTCCLSPASMLGCVAGQHERARGADWDGTASVAFSHVCQHRKG